MEIILLCLLASWALVRYGVTDAIAAAKGTESPRVGERRQRAAHAHERAMARTGPTVGEAIAGRIASRIANPKRTDGTPRQRGPARQFAAQLWGDSWAWAAEKRCAQQDRSHARREQRTGGTGDTGGSGTDLGAGRRAPGEATAPDGGETDGWGWTYDPGQDSWPTDRHATGRHTRGPAATEPSEPPVLDGEVVDTVQHGDTEPDDVIDAEEVDPPTSEQGAATPLSRQASPTTDTADGARDDPVQPDESGHQEPLAGEPLTAADSGPAPNQTEHDTTDPTQNTSTTTGTTTGTTTDAPLASVHPIREDITTMSAPTAEHTVGSGETLDPGAAKRFAEQIKVLGEQVNQSLETSISNLEQRGVSGEPIDLFRQMQDAALTLVGNSETARTHFERHEATQDQVLSDDTLAGTVEGTYVGTKS